MSLISLMIFCLSISSSAFAGWHDWTQAQRNQAIVNEAYSWTNGIFGNECKVFAYNVVKNASSGCVLLPGNNGNCSWKYSPNVTGRSQDIAYVLPGEIIQMQVTYNDGTIGPHTAIVVAKDLYGITFKESNWCLHDCQLVGTRYITFINFRKQAPCYTLNSVK